MNMTRKEQSMKDVDGTSDLMCQIIQCGISAQANDAECHSIWDAQGCSSLGDFQVPEPWNGDIANAKLLFLSINPGYVPNEFYPRKGNLWWIDENGDWAINKVDDFFTNRFSSTHKYVLNESGRRFRIKMEDDSYKTLRRSFWGEIHKIATLILNNDDVQIGKDYALTELVHCKTKRESDIEERCYSHCLTLWLGRVLNVAKKVERIVVIGRNPRTLIGQFVQPKIVSPKCYEWYERSIPGGKKFIWLFIDHPAAYQCRAVSRVESLIKSNHIG